MTGIDIVTLITNIGFPAGFSIVLLWMLTTKIETISERQKSIESKIDLILTRLNIVQEIRDKDAILKQLDKIEYLISGIKRTE